MPAKSVKKDPSRLRSRKLVRQPGQPRHDRALPRALHELGTEARGAAGRQADHRHRAVGLGPVAVQPPSPRARRIACAKASAKPAASRSSFPCTRSRKPASARPRRSTAICAISGWSRLLYGYFIDGVVLTTGCDKTTPAQLMAAATVDIPAIVLSGGPMLNGWFRGERTGSGTIVWKARELLAAGEINDEEFIELVASSAPSPGHCNTMGTASTMNSLAEALGMSLPGCAAIPAPHKDRAVQRLRNGQAHRRDGVGRPAPVEDHDARGVRERDRRQLGDRRLDQRADPFQRDRAPHRRRSSTTTTGRRSATTSRCS